MSEYVDTLTNRNLLREPIKTVGRRVPNPILGAYLGAHIRCRHVYYWFTRGNATPPDRIVWVDPDSITHTVTWNELKERDDEIYSAYFKRSKYKLAGTIRGGDWDRVDRRFTDGILHRSFVAHFRRGVPWEETDLFAGVTSRIASGEEWWGCSTEAQFRDRCEELDRLYERMAKHGYKTQRELLYQSDAPMASRGTRDRIVHKPRGIVYGEIALHIGRDGEWIFQDGRNRLSIAKILELDEIPAVVLVRHQRWQRLRNMVARGEIDRSSLENDDHPDLRNLDPRRVIERFPGILSLR